MLQIHPCLNGQRRDKLKLWKNQMRLIGFINSFKLESPNQCDIFFSLLQENLHGYRDMLRLPRKIAKDSDELIIDEVETAIINAEKKCSKGKCTLPETQHLQIRVHI